MKSLHFILNTVHQQRFAALYFLMCVTPITANAASPYQQQEDVVFAQSHGVAITMDIFTPQQNPNGLAIIDVASGAWSSDRGKIRDHKRALIFDIFCKRGYTVFAVRPGSLSRFSCADMVDHVEQAIKWVKSKSEQYQIDPDRIGIVGASAGGHLASLVALRQKTPVAAAGVFFPPTDFLKFEGKPIDPQEQDGLGALARALAFPDGIDSLTEAEIQSGLKSISPAHQVTAEAPPFLLIHGDADRVVPLEQSERLVAALKKNDVPVELIVKPGGGHPWFTIPVEVSKLADWFDTQLSNEKK
ncbi:MAG: alpha/beta hydrolase [Planctomycetaceae bacterium]|nr:alpha/beta hydrolase [Planctomycetaceae bacterium]